MQEITQLFYQFLRQNFTLFYFGAMFVLMVTISVDIFLHRRMEYYSLSRKQEALIYIPTGVLGILVAAATLWITNGYPIEFSVFLCAYTVGITYAVLEIVMYVVVMKFSYGDEVQMFSMN